MAELLTAAIDYGNEIIDAEVRPDNVDVQYMDAQGVERRVGAKTRFENVRGARVLRVSRRTYSSGPVEGQGLTSMGVVTRKKPRKGGGRKAKSPKGGADAPTAAVDLELAEAVAATGSPPAACSVPAAAEPPAAAVEPVPPVVTIAPPPPTT